MKKLRCRPNAIVHVRRLQRERGVIAILTALLLLVILGFCGLALDLSRLYNRKIEMENVAATTALAAATSLNGTVDGINAAVAAASSRLTDQPPRSLAYQYNKGQMAWSNGALKFSSSPNGEWVDVASALENPAGLLFAKVDTAGLDSKYGQVSSMLIQVMAKKGDTSWASSSAAASAIAGRSSINVLPLALCAMDVEAAHNRASELVEYGFRRGVSYDLMQLNPNPGAAAGQTFLVNPTVAPGAAGTSPDIDTVKPFVCSGTIGIPKVIGNELTVESPFPLNLLYGQLNSRFDTFVAPCNEYTAPPDLNVKSYVATAAGVPWMSTVPAGQAALLSTVGHRWTIADVEPSPAGTLATQYGPLWAYARAVKFAPNEPANGYSTFDTSDWKKLYDPGKPASSGYPTGTPYAPGGPSSTVQLPPSGRKGMAGRRVLNISLLSCPVSGNKAMVLGVGRFFMMVPATATSLHAEFAGLISDQKLGRQVELYK